jgi:hypothetical protein
VVGIAERGDGDGLAFDVLERADLARRLWRGDDGEQRQPPGDGEAANVGVHIGIRLDRHVEGGRGIVDRAADQCLHGRLAPPRIDDLHVEAVALEQAGRPRDLVRHTAQKLTAIGELYPLPLGFGGGGAQSGNHASNYHRPLQHGAA